MSNSPDQKNFCFPPHLWRRLASLSVVVNLLYLVSPLYMLQVYDRVLASKSIETLIYLTLIAAFLLGVAAFSEFARKGVMTRGSKWLKQNYSNYFSKQQFTSNDPRKWIELNIHNEKLANFLGSTASVQLLDLPWVIIFLIVLLMIHPFLALISVVAIITLILNSVIYTSLNARIRHKREKIGKTYKNTRALMDNYTETMRATGHGSALIRSNGNILENLLPINQDQKDKWSKFTSSNGFIKNLAQILTLGMAAWLVIRGEISAGSIFASSILMGRSVAPVVGLSQMWNELTQTWSAYKNLSNEELLNETMLPEGAFPKSSKFSADKLVLSNPETGDPIIKGISFKLDEGQLLAICGVTGSGKSVLARGMAAGWYANNGSISIDGYNIYQLYPDHFSKVIGFCPDDLMLLDDTIINNISRGKDCTFDDIVDAAITVGVHNEILSLKEGYNTLVGTNGIKLPFLIRKKVALARAFFQNPLVLILDSPFAGLDPASAKLLSHALELRRSRNKTTICVGNSRSLSNSADLVLQLEKGLIKSLKKGSRHLTRSISNAKIVNEARNYAS